MQNHLLLMYFNVQALPIASKVIVPVPEDFQPAFVTVTTMLPTKPYMDNTLTCPFTPAGSVATSAPAVLK